MPGKVKVRILAGRNLPVMDRTNDTTDAYVEVRMGNTNFKTDVFRKSLNPQWKSEWFRFELDDWELQDEPLQIRLMDHDTYSANDSIGKVYLDLNPLLLPKSSSRGNMSDGSGTTVLSGWIPVYDTMHGIRGEVNVLVKVELFTDFNKFRQSSCGVQFFSTPSVPFGYRVQAIHGFVEELVINDDPEYQWIDKIRTPRASNEARQILFSKLSGEVMRKIGLKTLELGGNAVVGYRVCFDLEGESGIVVRGIGSSVTLVKRHDSSTSSGSPLLGSEPNTLNVEDLADGPISPKNNKQPCSPAKNGHSVSGTSPHALGGSTRTSDSDTETPPRGNPSNNSWSDKTKAPPLRQQLHQESFDMLEYPFLTMSSVPPNFIKYLGGTVSAYSVKLLDKINHLEEPETRDVWWSELRTEIRSHARALACNVVLAYEEHTTICDEVCILSASGTATVIHGHLSNDLSVSTFRQGKGIDKNRKLDAFQVTSAIDSKQASVDEDAFPVLCSLCHIPYNESSVPFPVQMKTCSLCRHGRVPDILLCTMEPPPGLPILGYGCLIQARICRVKREVKGEASAKEVSDCLPFLQYEMHRQILNKMKIKGMNALFGLKVQIVLGEKVLVALATGTGMYIPCLPKPSTPKITALRTNADSQKLKETQKLIEDTVIFNRERYGLKLPSCVEFPGDESSDTDVDSDDDLAEMDLSSGNKDACVLEIDDTEDIDMLSVVLDRCPPRGYNVVSTDFVPGLTPEHLINDLQLFTYVWRGKLLTQPSQFSKLFDKVLQSLYFKLRRLAPCALSKLSFTVDLPEIDELQISVLGIGIGVKDGSDITNCKEIHHFNKLLKVNKDDPELIFKFDGINDVCSGSNLLKGTKIPSFTLQKIKSCRAHFGVDLSPLPCIPGCKIERYLGNLNFFFIRESNSIRECGGLSGFAQHFNSEVLAIVRAHVAALGGNAMVAYFMSACILMFNPHKNQAQCLINVGGDAVLVSSEQTT